MTKNIKYIKIREQSEQSEQSFFLLKAIDAPFYSLTIVVST